MSHRQAREASLPSTCSIAYAPPPVRSGAALDSLRSLNPIVNCTCEGSRLCTLYENLMSDDVTVSDHLQIGPSSCRKTNLGPPLILHYGELCNYFIIYYNVKIEIKCTMNVMCLNQLKTTPSPLLSPLEKWSSTEPVPGPGAKNAGDH